MHHATRAPGWRPGYRPALDGLRAVAVLLVILNHAGVPGFAHWAGQAGVSIFFVISGYLITGLLIARRERLLTFWRRRALRLLPALGFLLLVITPLSLLLGRHSAWGDALVGALYVGNWERALGGGMGDLSHLWSLAIEEQFYLVWPLALLFLRPRARWLVALAVGLALLRPLVTPDMAIFGTFGRADALLLGGAVALSGVRFPSWSAWAGLALVVLIGVLQPDDAAVAAWGLTLASVAGVLLVGGLAQRPAMGLDRPAPRTIGRISYGLYLWDYALVSLFGPILGSLGCVVMAAASYRFVELPFLRLKDRHRARDSQPVNVSAIGQRSNADSSLLSGRCVHRVDNSPRNGPDSGRTAPRWPIRSAGENRPGRTGQRFDS
jgi:peptidoglycan/LPS O-acetylase OafA/YrhL